MRRITVAVFGLLFSLFISAQNVHADPPRPPNIPSNAEVEKAHQTLADQQIAIISCDQSNNYHQQYTDQISQRLTDLNFAFKLYDSKADPKTQIDILNQIVSEQHTAVLILCNLFGKDVNEAIKNAISSIPNLILYGGTIDSQTLNTTKNPSLVTFRDADAQVGFAAGQLAGQWISRHKNGSANVLILNYPDLASIVIRANAMESGLHKNAPNAHIIARLKGGTGKLGQKNLADYLAKTGAVIPDVILSINDAGSLGAIKTLQNTPQLKNDIAIFSIDGDPQALADLKDGHYYQGIVTIDPRANADQAVNSAIHQLSGSPFKHILDPGLKPISNP